MRRGSWLGQVIKSYVSRHACHADTVELAERRADRVSVSTQASLGLRSASLKVSLCSSAGSMQLCDSVSLMSCTVLTSIRALAHISVAATNESVKQEGWIHHLARHAVACYLTRGQCYISWERGTEVFDGRSDVGNRIYYHSP